MWSILKGVSGQVQEAVSQISCHEDVWRRPIGNGLFWAFYRDNRLDEGVALIEELAQHVTPKTLLLFESAKGWLDIGETRKAHEIFNRIIELNESEWYVELQFAQGYIYESENLNIGQPAPLFSLKDIGGKFVDLANCHGKVLVLHFWSATCSFCRLLCPHLRKIAKEYPEDKVALIGVSKDTDLDLCRAKVEEEGFTWPQICEGNGWKDTVFRLYNITGIPRAYIIDSTGRIAFKIVGGKSGEELEEAVRSLIVG